jgi:hypothetical protein
VVGLERLVHHKFMEEEVERQLAKADIDRHYNALLHAKKQQLTVLDVAFKVRCSRSLAVVWFLPLINAHIKSPVFDAGEPGG